MRLTGAAIFQVTVPATIMRSDWRGEGRNNSAPKRAMSYRGIAVAIISIAQQARPKATGQSEERRAQLTMPSTVESMMFCLSDSSRDSAAVSVTLMRWSDMLTRLGRLRRLAVLGSQELTQNSHELAGLVFWDQRVAVGDFDEPAARKGLSQTAAVHARHHAVFGSPDDEYRPVERTDASCGVEKIAPPGGACVLPEVAPDGTLRDRRAQPGIHDVIRDRPLAHPTEDQRQAAQRS